MFTATNVVDSRLPSPNVDQLERRMLVPKLSLTQSKLDLSVILPSWVVDTASHCSQSNLMKVKLENRK